MEKPSAPFLGQAIWLIQMTGGFIVPAEWTPHAALWTAWPSAEDLWLDDLLPAQAEVAAMIRALSNGDKVRVLACGDAAVASARTAVGDVAEIIPFDFGDIWMRDTAPVFSRNDKGAVRAEIFRFNGWGEKYLLPHDDGVATRLAALADRPANTHSFILEGGSVDADGAGAVLTTRECLLNDNRNQGWTERDAEEALAASYGARHVIWLPDGLVNDHTDGHVDNIARFVGPGHVVCQRANGADDPNADRLKAIEEALRGAKDASGQGLRVTLITSPGLVTDEEDEAVAASHMNFIIGNKTVVVPVYNDHGADAVKALAAYFPGRDVVGLSARSVLTGGGSFHCITQQQPA